MKAAASSVMAMTVRAKISTADNLLSGASRRTRRTRTRRVAGPSRTGTGGDAGRRTRGSAGRPPQLARGNRDSGTTRSGGTRCQLSRPDPGALQSAARSVRGWRGRGGSRRHPQQQARQGQQDQDDRHRAAAAQPLGRGLVQQGLSAAFHAATAVFRVVLRPVRSCRAWAFSPHHRVFPHGQLCGMLIGASHR